MITVFHTKACQQTPDVSYCFNANVSRPPPSIKCSLWQNAYAFLWTLNPYFPQHLSYFLYLPFVPFLYFNWLNVHRTDKPFFLKSYVSISHNYHLQNDIRFLPPFHLLPPSPYLLNRLYQRPDDMHGCLYLQPLQMHVFYVEHEKHLTLQ